MSDYLMQTYARQPVSFVRGEGAWLYDSNGDKYLDALAGVAVNGLGHAHPRLVKALCEQAGKLIHTSNIYRIPEQEALAERLCQLSGLSRAFFCNSGAEANEAAISYRPLARTPQWCRKPRHRGNGKEFSWSYHGDLVRHRQP